VSAVGWTCIAVDTSPRVCSAREQSPRRLGTPCRSALNRSGRSGMDCSTATGIINQNGVKSTPKRFIFWGRRPQTSASGSDIEANMDAKNFPARLRQFREKRGMTQKTLAALMGVKQATISKWELGDRETSHGELIRLATILGCGLADFFSEPDIAPN